MRPPCICEEKLITDFSLSLGLFSLGFVRRHWGYVGELFAFPWPACANGMHLRDRGHMDLLDASVGCDDGTLAGLCWYLAHCRNPSRRMRMKSSHQRIRRLHAVCGRCNILLLHVSGIDEMILRYHPACLWNSSFPCLRYQLHLQPTGYGDARMVRRARP